MVRCWIVLGDNIPKILPMYSEVHPSSNGIETEWASAMPTVQSIPIGLSSDGPMTAHHIVTFRTVASYAKFSIYFSIRTHFLYFTLPQQYNIYIKSFIIHSLFWTLLSFYLSLSFSLSHGDFPSGHSKNEGLFYLRASARAFYLLPTLHIPNISFIP